MMRTSPASAIRRPRMSCVPPASKRPAATALAQFWCEPVYSYPARSSSDSISRLEPLRLAPDRANGGPDLCAPSPQCRSGPVRTWHFWSKSSSMQTVGKPSNVEEGSLWHGDGRLPRLCRVVFVSQQRPSPDRVGRGDASDRQPRPRRARQRDRGRRWTGCRASRRGG